MGEELLKALAELAGLLIADDHERNASSFAATADDDPAINQP